MTLAIPKDLHQIMRKHAEIKWSEVARQALWTQAKKMEMIDTFLAKSTMSQEDAEQIGHKIKQGIAKKHGLVK